MQSAKSGVSRVLGLLARLISVPKAYIRSCYVLTVTVIVSSLADEVLESFITAAVI